MINKTIDEFPTICSEFPTFCSQKVHKYDLAISIKQIILLFTIIQLVILYNIILDIKIKRNRDRNLRVIPKITLGYTNNREEVTHD